LPPKGKESEAIHGSTKRSVAPSGGGKIGRAHPYKRPTKGTLGLKKLLPEEGGPSHKTIEG